MITMVHTCMHFPLYFSPRCSFLACRLACRCFLAPCSCSCGGLVLVHIQFFFTRRYRQHEKQGPKPPHNTPHTPNPMTTEPLKTPPTFLSASSTGAYTCRSTNASISAWTSCSCVGWIQWGCRSVGSSAARDGAGQDMTGAIEVHPRHAPCMHAVSRAKQ